MTGRPGTRKYTVTGETPAQKNEVRYARGRTYKSGRFREWREAALWELRAQGIPERPYQSAEIEVLFVHSDLRRRDGDNQLSSVQDLLVAAGVIEDDCWTRIGTPRVSHSVGPEARCEIRVFEVVAVDWKEQLLETKKKSVLADVAKFRLDKKHIEDLSVLETYQNPIIPA